MARLISKSQKKTFHAKICRDDYAKKYSNKVYIGMAVCEGRGDDIKHKAGSLAGFQFSTSAILFCQFDGLVGCRTSEYEG